MNASKNKKGFTLIELLVYIGIASIVLFAIIGQYLALLQMRAKHQTIAEVEQQGEFVMHLITQTVRNAEAINSPSIGTSASILSVDVIEAADDPTLFDIFGGRIRVTEGAGSAANLTSILLNTSSLLFENVSGTGTPGAVRIQFTLSRVNTAGIIPYAYEKTFYGTASLRP